MRSSVIRSFNHDAARRRLEILFVNGRRYVYHGVPARIAAAFAAASSAGAYFNSHIRDRYRHTHLRKSVSPMNGM
ncbi:KTSC domain-containing protein [Sphingomonas oleivorans]|uniref:KTSC domain-containing protein n=1 Tax=Sphingomonas oleivorans TaxID=1735121 RepID=A0A2T5G314_9SPHN|nr:KTSC domain-containing protein [Sphingomonas oleivorans]